MMTYKDYKHVIPIQVRFSDIDRLNHVNNACYHNYFELARVRYFNQVLQPQINWSDNGFVLARTEIDHLLPLFLNDEVYCFTKVSKLGNKSITVNNMLVKMVDGVMVESAAVTGILVAMDYKNDKSILIPPHWRGLFEKFEQ